MKALEAAFAKARSLNVIVGVAVVDARGDLVASARMDDSLWWWVRLRFRLLAIVVLWPPKARRSRRAR
ncbi:MAG: heme-binding protein [Proteobacteria bacterium]|nr:heme-binding protein [Pseudomonadota bacterium]